MSKFESVLIYSQNGDFLGFAIKGENKLQSTNIWTEGQEANLSQQLQRLNEDVDIRQYWPHPQDPEVKALLDDPKFMEIDYIETEVVDDDRSHYVWQLVPEVDDQGRPTGHLTESDTLDEEASVIVYKLAKVPARPTDVMWRIKKASEIIARRRAGVEDLGDE